MGPFKKKNSYSLYSIVQSALRNHVMFMNNGVLICFWTGYKSFIIKSHKRVEDKPNVPYNKVKCAINIYTLQVLSVWDNKIM